MTSDCFITEIPAENNIETIKKFLFHSKVPNSSQDADESLEIIIPELTQPGYSFYTWPSATILAWFLWERRRSLVDKRILEIGCGTALPGILSAKCGAHVTLSDNCILPKTLNHIHRCCTLNKLEPGKDIKILGISWGILLNTVLDLEPLDLIIASDCFYDPTVFEEILVTISFILDSNPSAKFITAYQERSSDWTIQTLLQKWDLTCSNINLENIGKNSEIDLNQLMGSHSIYLLEIKRK